MIVAGTKQNQPKFAKLNNGRIIKKIDEQYIRCDLPCGLANCPFCDKNYSKPPAPYLFLSAACRLHLQLASAHENKRADAHMRSADSSNSDDESGGEAIDRVFVIDHQFALNQIDFIENCPHLKNVVVADSVLKHMNKV